MSRPSQADRRYERYAEGEPETAESIERGRRVLHHEFGEMWNPYDAVRNRAQTAQETARYREGRVDELAPRRAFRAKYGPRPRRDLASRSTRGRSR